MPPRQVNKIKVLPVGENRETVRERLEILLRDLDEECPDAESIAIIVKSKPRDKNYCDYTTLGNKLSRSERYWLFMMAAKITMDGGDD